MIADDEAPARARLRDMLADTGGWSVVAEAANGNEVLAQCAAQAPDVVLLDIRMPEMDGIEVASHLSKLLVPPAVVFTTAYDEYAVKAFDTHAVGYLLKPVRRERLLRALERAARVSRMQLAALAENHPEIGGRKNIPVNLSGALKLVPVESIVSFHADQKYVRMVYHSEGDANALLQESLIDESLKTLETEFAQDFVRIHRNSLVRVDEIVSIERDASGQNTVALRSTGDMLPVSRRHVAALRQRVK